MMNEDDLYRIRNIRSMLSKEELLMVEGVVEDYRKGEITEIPNAGFFFTCLLQDHRRLSNSLHTITDLLEGVMNQIPQGKEKDALLKELFFVKEILLRTDQ